MKMSSSNTSKDLSVDAVLSHNMRSTGPRRSFITNWVATQLPQNSSSIENDELLKTNEKVDESDQPVPVIIVTSLDKDEHPITNLEQSVDDLATSTHVETSNYSVCNTGELSSIIDEEDGHETKSESSDGLSARPTHLSNDYQSPSPTNNVLLDPTPKEDTSQDTLGTPIASPLSRVRAKSFPPSFTSNKTDRQMTLFQRAVTKVQQELKSNKLEEAKKKTEDNEESKETEDNEESKETEENEESKETIEKGKGFTRLVDIAMMAKQWKKRGLESTTEKEDKDIEAEAEHRRTLAALPEDVLNVIFEESLPVVLKTHHKYHSQMGPKHQLTVKAMEKANKLAERIGKEPVFTVQQ